MNCTCSSSDPKVISIDLGVSFIHRSPEIDFVENGSNPLKDGWPIEGQDITWDAAVYNPSQLEISKLRYVWLLNGAKIDSGVVRLSPNGLTIVKLNSKWSFTEHTIRFVIDPVQELNDLNEQNNSLEIYSRAISLGYYIEQSVFKYYKNNNFFQEHDVYSWYDYAQIQVKHFNEFFKYYNVTERLRLDKVTIVDDGMLPLNKDVYLDYEKDPNLFDRSQAVPNLNDKTVDIQWGFPVEGDYEGSLVTSADYYVLNDRPNGLLLHENLHVRYLLDNYSFSIFHGTGNSHVDIKENGYLIAGSKYLQGKKIITNSKEGLLLYNTKHKDLMENISNYSLSPFSVKCINLQAGIRAHKGNYNEPQDFKEFLLKLLPTHNILTLRDSKSGAILGNASVKIYQASEPSELTTALYAKYFDDVPDILLQTDTNGKVDVGRNPFGPGQVVPLNEKYFGGSIIIRVEHNNTVGYTVIEASDFISKYLDGSTEESNYSINVSLFN